jgi:peptide-methionine (R)-S-oxide reductase
MLSVDFTRRRLLGAGTLAAIGATFAACSRSAPAAAAERYEVTHSAADWKKRLGPNRFRILREAGTEAPYSSPLNKEHRRGTFACAGCGLPLFSSTTKFDSGTGWPSFYAALPNAIRTRTDGAFGMNRTEEHCRRCGGHLGHIFDDGPRPTGKRHCINGLSLTFRPA